MYSSHLAVSHSTGFEKKKYLPLQEAYIHLQQNRSTITHAYMDVLKLTTSTSTVSIVVASKVDIFLQPKGIIVLDAFLQPYTQ